MLSRRHAWTVALVATLTMTVSYIDRTALAVLGPSVTTDLHLSEQQFGLLASAFAIAYLFATPLAGWWIDRIGARGGLVVSILAWTTVAGLHALVPGFGVLFAMRIALGVTEGPSFPGAAQTVQRVLPPAEHSRGFGVLFTGSSIGGMIVPPLASAMFNVGGWRFAFLGTAIAGLMWIPAWIIVTRHPDVKARLDAHELVRSDTPRPTFGDLVRDRNMIRAWCAVLAAAPITGFGLTWGAKLLAREHHITQGDVGHYLWLAPLLFDLGAITFGDLASRGRNKHALFAVATLLAVSFVSLRFAPDAWSAVIFIGIGMAGGGGLYTIATAELLSRTAPSAVSLAGGTVAAAQSVIHFIVNPLIGRSVDHFHSYDVAITALACWAIPGAIAWQLLRPRSM